ncbi:MAG TPA: TonB-dependent receptor [Gemmatimonadales bacterium]|nr:TonB-dependent receptor [Gemmatimonadales bacterium]
MKLTSALGFAGLLLVPRLLTAQQPDTTKADTTAHELPPIEVVGSIAPAAGPTIGSGVPARVTTLNEAQVDAYEPRILSDALKSVAGFSTYDDLGSPYKLNLSSRGFYSSPVVGLPQGLAVFLDGVRMNEPEASQVNFDLLPMDHIQRIEILSGNGSLLGRNALGGAINLVTARGSGPTSGTVELSGGSFGAARGEAHVSGMAHNGMDWYVGGNYNREDGWRQDTGDEGYQGFVNVGKLGETEGIRFQAFYARDRAEPAGSLPQSIVAEHADSNLTTGDYENLWAYQGSAQAYKQFGLGRASATVYFRRHRAERFNANQEDDPDAFGISYNNSFGYTADYRWTTVLNNTTALSLRGGVDGEVTRVKIDIFADSIKFGGGRTLTTQARSPLWDVAPFAAADLTIGKVTLSAGARYDYVRIPFENSVNPEGDTTATYKRFNPRIGASVEVAPGTSVFASWGQAFRAPAVIENACADPEAPCPLPFALGDDPPLQPVKASTVEAGARYVGDRVSLNGSVYYTSVKNDIFLSPFGDENEPAGSTIDGFFVNLDKTRRVGLEASGTYAFPRGHSVYLNYSYTRATFQSDAGIFTIRSTQDAGGEPVVNPFPTKNDVTPGDRFPLVPDHQIKLGGLARVGRYVSVGADARYIGKQYLRGDEANVTDQLDGYFVADARVGVEFGRWEINAIVTNLFQNENPIFGTFNINQGNPGGLTVERFLTPNARRAFRLVVRTRLGGPGTPHAGGADND